MWQPPGSLLGAESTQDTMNAFKAAAGFNSEIPPLISAATIKCIHYFSPLLLLGYCIATTIYASIQDAKERTYMRKKRIILLTWLIVGVLLTYMGQAILILFQALSETGQWASEHKNFYVMASMLSWGFLQISFLEETDPVWYPYWGSWLIGLLSELMLLGLRIWTPEISDDFGSQFQVMELAFVGSKILLQFLLVILLPVFRQKEPPPLDIDGETSGLLTGQATATYGTTDEPTLAGWERKRAEVRDQIAKRKEEAGGWWAFAKAYIILWKHMWPRNNRVVQARILAVFALLGIERGLNVLVPMQMGKVTEVLASSSTSNPRLWLQVSIFVFYRWLASGSGIRALHQYIWLSVQQHAHRALSVAAYNHILDLSCDFHNTKKTAELVTAFNRGRSMDGFIDLIMFSVLPNIADFAIAFTYFYILYSTYMALVIGFVAITYVKISQRLSAAREQIRRRYNKSLEGEFSQLQRSFGSWATVSYFNRFTYEKNRYVEAVGGRLTVQLEYEMLIQLVSVAQNLVFTIGLLVGSFVAVYEATSSGQTKVGNFVTFLTYWAQLSVPLSFFTSLAKQIQESMVDAERLLEILTQMPAIVVKPDAKDLVITKGDVEFSDVSFSYDKRKLVLQNISFCVPGGKTIAFVGETGGGKSTILKLLFRFYDVDSGTITIDGQNIQDVTLTSLRDSFGIVPQEPSMFDGSIMENLRYARFEATDEEVYEACKAACIHDKIVSFPDGYLTRVGENGIRLSGGEKQRIAIARAFLKSPQIILLDEATSAVDVLTERTVQDALATLTTGRTVFVIAHRLTTIMNADLIIVLKDGEISERGNHGELMRQKGIYWSYWTGSMNNGGVDLVVTSADKGPRELLLQTPDTQSQAKDNINPAAGLHIKFALEEPKGATHIFRPHTLPNKSFMSTLAGTATKKDDNSSHKRTVLKPDAKEFIPGSLKLSLEIPATASSAVQTPSRGEWTGQISEVIGTCAATIDEHEAFHAKAGENVEATPDSTGNCTERKHRRRRRRSRSKSIRNSSEGASPNTLESQQFGPLKCIGNTIQTQNAHEAALADVSSRPTSASTTTEKSAGSTPTTPISPISFCTANQGLGEVMPNLKAKDKSAGISRKTFSGRSRKNTGTGVENLSKPGKAIEHRAIGSASGKKPERD